VSASIGYTQSSTAVAGTGTTSAGNDTNAANNTATFNVAGSAADMSAAFTGFPASAPVGSSVTGTVNFVNTSATNTATTPTFALQLTPGINGVVVNSVVLGAGTYNSGTGVVTFASPAPLTLAAGATVSASIGYTQSSTSVAGTGTTSAQNDTNTANNTATFNVAGNAADMSAAFTGFPVSAPVGSSVTGTVNFVNTSATNTATTPTFALQLTPGINGVVVNSANTASSPK